MGFDTDDTFLYTYSHGSWGRQMSGDLSAWLKSRMLKIDRRLSELSRRLTTREVKPSVKQR
jgi:hypothetical protein